LDSSSRDVPDEWLGKLEELAAWRRRLWFPRFFFMTILCRWVLSWVVVGLVGVRAQSLTVTQALPAASYLAGSTGSTVDLAQHFGFPGVTGQIAQVETTLGRFNIELLADDAPLTVANFLGYVNSGAYTNALFHRSVPGFVIQTGGFKGTLPIADIAASPSVRNEFRRSNTRGTLAMAKLGSGPDTATNQWFVNLANNSANLDNQNGGFTVFARVLGTGMLIPDAIATIPIFNAGSPFDSLPLRNFTSGGSVAVANFIVVNSVRVIPMHPVAGGGSAVITYTVQTDNPSVVTAAISGSTLNVTPVGGGSAAVTVRATDSNGNQVTSSFTAQVTTPVAPPVITLSPPVGVNAAAGQTVVLNVVATGTGVTYQWKRIGSPSLVSDVPGATQSSLVFSSVQAASAGTYFCTVSNSAGSVDSAGTILAISEGLAASRLTNLAVRSFAGQGDKALIAGFVTRGTGSKQLAIRGIGPALVPFNIPNLLEDPNLEIRSTGTDTPIVGSNDNWTNDDGRNYGGFPLTAGSKDAVLVSPLAAGGYTAQVRGAGATTGNALVEVYDAALTNTAVSFVNLSARTQIDAGQILIAGVSVSAGASKSLLIRAVGPKLSDFGVGGVLSDPKIEVFNSAGTKIMENDNWGGAAALVSAGGSVGAFGLDAASKDAALALTVAPGGYTVQVSGVQNASGVVLVEVYELP